MQSELNRRAVIIHRIPNTCKIYLHAPSYGIRTQVHFYTSPLSSIQAAAARAGLRVNSGHRSAASTTPPTGLAGCQPPRAVDGQRSAGSARPGEGAGKLRVLGTLRWIKAIKSVDYARPTI